MIDMDDIPDRQARELAETTFDRNIVVVAGAGTGKTTLLVNRLVHLLMKNPDPVSITQLVALTFTNKASMEMKARLRERLTILKDSDESGFLRTDGGAVSTTALCERYGLSADVIANRATEALANLEKAQIGTLHSFAAHLLRLYPLESGVDPAFREDDGLRFEEHFTSAWDIWIDHELSRAGIHHHLWRSFLRIATLDDLQEFTRSLCSELVDVEEVQRQMESAVANPVVAEWWRRIAKSSHALLKKYDRSKRRKIEHMLAATGSFMNLLVEQGPAALGKLSPSDREWLDKDLGATVAGWEEMDFHEASRCIGAAQDFLTVDDDFFKKLLTHMTPFVLAVRSTFSQKGWLSFDGLLAKARNLLRDHPVVRERIKQEYRVVLVDEFQDTDPVQYEIILAVSERLGCYASTWSEISLQPGKLFIVGDPKQSIYAFRRADIEAFDRVVQKVVADHGMLQTLTTNFRSDAAVIGPLNDVFDRVFCPEPLVQPANVRLDVRPRGKSATIDPGVYLHVTVAGGDGEPFDSATATRAEGEVLGRWLKEDLLDRSAVRPGHVALLFRKLTQADTYLDAMRRYGIPYVVEGEKYFYRRQEVIDLVNLLRVLIYPLDAVAMAGLLRSPLGGLNDKDLYDVRTAGYFDYLNQQGLEGWGHPCALSVRRLYGHLSWLHEEVAPLPLADAVQLIFDRLPVLELAAASLHGEQAVANLLKVKQLAAALADRPHLTLSGFVDVMVSRLEEQPDESESPLAEDSAEAVQVLTIHKAKGLEFPVVVLPGLHHGSGRQRAVPNLTHDWSSGTYGLSLAGRSTFGWVLLKERLAMREAAERRRVLYVGMTRAKDLLVLSGARIEKSAGQTVLGLLEEIGHGEVGNASTTGLTVGASLIPHHVKAAPDRKRLQRSVQPPDSTLVVDPVSTARLWSTRRARWESMLEHSAHVTPTALLERKGAPLGSKPNQDRERQGNRLVGIVAHRLLERWDFSSTPEVMLEAIPPMVRRFIPLDQQDISASLIDSVTKMFEVFLQSKSYRRLGSAEILGREIPFLMPWEMGATMEGIIDVMYRLEGSIYVADYKTDYVTADEAPARSGAYALQASIYRTAALRCLGLSSVSFEFIFLRPGVSVAM